MDNLTTSFADTETEADTSPAANSDLNHHLLAEAKATLETGAPLHLTLPINPTDLAAGSHLAAAIADRFGGPGLAEGTVNITFHGHAGPGFGTANTTGIELTLIGAASDCVGQEMAGGQIVVRPSLKSQLEVGNGAIAGDFVLEEAYGGNLFVAGKAGDHFAFRNYGATAIVEGIGDFACAEMADGVVVVLGPIGAQFGGGMQGGLVFMLNADCQIPQTFSANDLLAERVTGEADTELLRYLITRHVRLTGSTRGQEILDDWPAQLEQFWKITPQAVGAIPSPRVIPDTKRF